jgi:hypothetical protein
MTREWRSIIRLWLEAFVMGALALSMFFGQALAGVALTFVLLDPGYNVAEAGIWVSLIIADGWMSVALSFVMVVAISHRGRRVRQAHFREHILWAHNVLLYFNPVGVLVLLYRRHLFGMPRWMQYDLAH